MRFLRINKKEDLYLLKNFVNSLNSEKQSFKYYDNRKFSVVSNHEFTYLLINDQNEAIGYGHIDKEENDYWLGIVISEKHQQKGHGVLMMNKLIQECIIYEIHRITLSVRKNNEKAINLYNRFGFSIFREDKINLFLEKYL